MYKVFSPTNYFLNLVVLSLVLGGFSYACTDQFSAKDRGTISPPPRMLSLSRMLHHLQHFILKMLPHETLQIVIFVLSAQQDH